MVIFRLSMFLFLGCTVYAQNPYEVISKRNAFQLATEAAAPVLPPVVDIVSPVDIYLTGITKHITPKAHLVIKEKGVAKNKFLSLKEGQTQDNISVIKILKNSVIVNNNGRQEQLAFKTHGLPTVIMKAPVVKTATKGSKSSSKDVKSSSPTPPTPRPQIVPVPSRKPRIDPRILERGLEYISKIEDKEKKEYILQRLEKLQNGQEKIDRKIDSNERRRRYDEYRKNK